MCFFIHKKSSLKLKNSYPLLQIKCEKITIDNVLEQNQIKTESAEVAWVPLSTVAVPEDKAAAFERLIDNLESSDDVQAVYHNAE